MDGTGLRGRANGVFLLSPGAWSSWNCTAPGNNGNVQSQAISFAAVGGAPAFSETQSYSELATVSTALWSEKNGYDAVGNRWVALRSGLPAVTQLTPQSASWFDAQNRISGWTYDGAGNLRTHPSRTFDFDAENRYGNEVTCPLNAASF